MIVPKFSGLDNQEVFTPSGNTKVSTGNIKFQQDVKLLLETPIGTMLGNPTFGSNLYSFLHSPITNGLGSLIQNEVRQRIEDNFEDIKIDEVNVTFAGHTIYLNIGFNNKNSNILEYIDLQIEGGE